MSGADALLSRLDGVRSSGIGRWSARCPAHADRSPSLSVRELNDGRILIHDFGGCDVHSVLAAVGLTMADLHPERERTPGYGAARERRPWNASDLLRLAAHESIVCVVVACDLAEGKPADHGRLIEAASRLQRISEVAHAK